MEIEHYQIKKFKFKDFEVEVTESSVQFYVIKNCVIHVSSVPSNITVELTNISTKIFNSYFMLQCFEPQHEEKMFRTLAFIFNIDLTRTLDI